ncbi:MAG: GGDEF domain-containing protein [Clostridiales Family XIII bacterium]|nr:GGDEF domain-containing protein [Clostridiales Family XIII bacterium]
MHRIPPELREQFEERRTETNVNRMYVFAIYVVVLQIALNLLNILKPTGSQNFDAAGGLPVDIAYYVVLSLATLLMGLLFWFLFARARKKRISGHSARILVNVFLYLYCAIQLVFCTFNILSGGGVNSYIIAVLILSMVPVIHPLQSLIGIGASFVYVCAAMYSVRDISQTWNSIVLTDTWTNLIIIIGLSVCGSVFLYDMYVSNFLQSVRLEKSNRELTVMANTDQMTGVANRRAFTRSFDDLWQQAVKDKRRLAVAIADIDFFKSYNDAFGHLEGDKCLMQVANCLQRSFRRASDIVSRYGGEEFLVVFEAESEEDCMLADKARENLQAMRIPSARTDVSPYVSISVGVCFVRPAADTPTGEALRAADDALYESKRGGRNRTTVRTYGPPEALRETSAP